MIKSIDDELDIVKIMRQMIMSQLNLSEAQVLNGESFRGADLHQNEDNYIYKPFQTNDLVIIFELLEDESSDDVVYPEEDDSLIINSSYSFKLTIYGEKSGYYSKLLRARILTDEVLSKLETEGIHIREVEYPSSSNEFINSILWKRKDLHIKLSVRLSGDKEMTSDEFSSADNIEILSN